MLITTALSGKLQVSSLKHTDARVSLRKNKQLLFIAESNNVLFSGLFAKAVEAL